MVGSGFYKVTGVLQQMFPGRTQRRIGADKQNLVGHDSGELQLPSASKGYAR
jgi:hypothetical protein